jgi:dephospho-CoA kinase
VVVLTGGIAAGKTAVSSRFARLGVAVIDTDIIARELVQAGQPALAAIVKEFGQEILDNEGTLNRSRMRDLIFSDPACKQKLEAILHPAIAQQVQQQINAVKTDYCILVVPLLAESGRYQWSDRVLVVDVDVPTQLQRVMVRDQISAGQATAILQAQASRQQRLALADDIIENGGDLAALDHAVASLHEKYRKLARRPQST